MNTDNTSLSDRAHAAMIAQQEADERKATERAEKRFETSRRMLIARVKELIGVDVAPESVTRSDKYGAEVSIDGLRFYYKPESEWRQLFLIRICTECGEGYSLSVHNLAQLGSLLATPKPHKCPDPLTTKLEVSTPLPTVEESLLEALQNFIWAKSYQG